MRLDHNIEAIWNICCPIFLYEVYMVRLLFFGTASFFMVQLQNALLNQLHLFKSDSKFHSILVFYFVLFIFRHFSSMSKNGWILSKSTNQPKNTSWYKLYEKPAFPSLLELNLNLNISSANVDLLISKIWISM